MTDFVFQFGKHLINSIRLLKGWTAEWAHDVNYPRYNGLGVLMEAIKKSKTEFSQSDRQNISQLASYLDAEPADLLADYGEYLKLLTQKAHRIRQSQHADTWWKWAKSVFVKPLEPVPLPEDYFNLWGSRRQLMCGKVVVDTLFSKGITKLDRPLHPVFGALLNPTGGSVGAGDQDLTEYIPGIHTADDPLVMHAIVHDAAGYCYNYHGVGPGYNYTGSWTPFPTSKPYSGQANGLSIMYALFARKRLKLH